MNLFESAKSVGLEQIRNWLPDGRQDGSEWVAINPTRNDKNIGSFRINTSSGLWIDNASKDSGGDAVSLYAYLFRTECEFSAINRGYKNIEGGIQTEAARIILEKYDPSYYPSEQDDFSYKKKEKQEPKCLFKGLANPPELDTSWYEEKFGPEVERWPLVKNRKTVAIIVRFQNKKGEKADRPFTLWNDNGKTKWRCKGLQGGKYPLYNADEIEKRPNDIVILYEGQKAPSRAENVIDNYVNVGWYGGTNQLDKTDFDPLIGHSNVYFWPDADLCGRLVIKKLQEYKVNFKMIYSPPGIKKGWDIADAIEAKWTKEQLVELIEREDPEIIGDDFPFKII